MSWALAVGKSRGVPCASPRMDVESATRRVLSRSFPQATDDLVGIELELLVTTAAELRPASLGQDLLVPATLPGGSVLTLEPGGQAELSSAPWHGLGELCRSFGDDLAGLRGRAQPGGTRLLGMGLLPGPLAPHRQASPRYAAMAAFFGRQGGAGSLMMTSTAALQVNVGAGPEREHEARWRRAHVLGPVLAATFANSPILRGAPSGLHSTRLANWFAMEPTRTRPCWRPGNGCEAWARYALDARVMLIRRDDHHFVALGDAKLSFMRWIIDGHELGFPTPDDLDYHLTTLFPPVRPKGWLELRYLDSLPSPWWQVATAVSAVLLSTSGAGARAERAAAPFADWWLPAARHGLRHPGLAAAARECFVAAAEALAAAGDSSELADAVADYAGRFVNRGRTPADDRLDAWRRTGSPLLPVDDLEAAAAAVAV